MTLHLTTTEAEQLKTTGSGVLFRAGERCECRTCINGTSGHRRPPAEFVEAAAACETCGGTQWWRQPDETSGGQVCVFCIEGKRRVAVVVPCEACKATGRIRQQHLNWNDTPCRKCDQATEPYQWPSGFVTVGHVVVTWGPLVVLDNITRVTNAPSSFLHYTHEGWERVENGVSVGIVPFPPDIDPQTLVGQYALGVEVVS